MELTERQRQIIDNLALGYTNLQMAKKLNLAPAYVQNILSVLYQKTDTKNKHHLVAWAYNNRVLKVKGRK